MTGCSEEKKTEGTVTGTEKNSVAVETAPTTQAAPSRELSPVAEVLAKSPTFNAKPDLQAKYYVYLVSASWCPPCRAEMPEIVSLYKQMKDDGVEIVLISADATQEKAQEYLTNFNATFPAMMPSQNGVTELPGYTPPRAIPHAIIVTNDGELVKKGHGSITMQYKGIINQYETQELGPAASAPAGEEAK